MNMAVPASFFQRDIATETAGFFGGGAGSTLDLDSVDSVLESGGLFAAASGSPGAVVTVGGGVNGATLELAVLARLDCQQCCWLVGYGAFCESSTDFTVNVTRLYETNVPWAYGSVGSLPILRDGLVTMEVQTT